MIRQAVILAGGRGLRLWPLTKDIPKPMAPVNGIPFLDYLIYSLVTSGIDEILILLGYKGEMIESRYKGITKLQVGFSTGDVEANTGRRLLNAFNQLSDHFLLVYGDNYWTLDLKSMWRFYTKMGKAVSTTVFSNKYGTGEYGFKNNVLVSDNNLVKRYDKKREDNESNGVDIGYFIINKSCLDAHLTDNLSFEDDILTKMISENEVAAYVTDIQYFYVTDMISLRKFEKIAVINNYNPLPNSYF